MAQTYTSLEDYIYKLLHRINITHPSQLTIELISQRLGITVHYLDFESACLKGHIFLDSRKKPSQQWQDFGHELCHALWHAGDQALIPLTMLEYQEWKAINFSLHLCIPSFMLESINLPSYDREANWLIQETFGVDYTFAAKRLEQYVRNLRAS